jgi:hypothetical protein
MKTTLLCLVLAAGCSELDPNVGPLRVQQPDVGDAGGDAAPDADPGECGEVCFGRDIRPLMNRGPKGSPKGCMSCHYKSQANHVGIDLGGLNLETLGSLRMGGGSSGTRIVVPGKPDESAIVQALRGQYPYAARMPKGGNYWTPEEIQKVADWIAEGAIGRPDE